MSSQSSLKHPASVSLLTETEQHRLLFEWNKTRVDYPQECLHSLFEAQVERTPDTIAVVFEREQLTYQELNQRANQLAHYLQQVGVGPEIPVGVFVERSLEMIVGVLGVLKAGGVYVPLDPVYPKERLAFMIADAQVVALLTQKHLLKTLTVPKIHAVCLDTDWELIARESNENLPPATTPDNLAYILYTSGSTGRPKGVMVSHRAVVNRLLWMQDTYQLTGQDCVLQKAAFGFDVAVWELFWPLMVGGQSVMARPDVFQDGAYLVKLIVEQQITVAHFVPSVLDLFLEAEGLETCHSLRFVLSGGEVLSAQLRDRFFARLKADLHNQYGQTETCIDVLYWTCQRERKGGIVPLGRPYGNTQIYILDPYLRPVPIGVTGELYIGGAGLARGYLGRPDLTAERFIPNPFILPYSSPTCRGGKGEIGTCLYKTGDLARYAPDGNVEFLGRLDYQVKVRGFRIELGEIEVVLSQHPAVRRTVVMVWDGQPGDKRLVAYVVPQEQAGIAARELRHFLLQKLPEYMVPSIFVFLEALPLTPNNKIDRRALPPPDAASIELGADFVPPRTPTEETVADVWVEILGLEKVGIYDNFFELGGHSLLATRVVSRIREAFEVELSLYRFFETPTVAGLAEHIEAILREASPASRATPPPIRPIPRDGNLPLSFAQQRLWFLDQLEGQSAAYNMPLALRLTGSLEVTILEQSLTEIVRRHEVLRTAFSVVNGSPVQVVNASLTVPLLVVDLQGLPEGEQSAKVRQLATAEAQKSFDLSKGPLLRVTLLQLSETEQVLLLIMHHIISDDWSIGIFIRELFTLYIAFLSGQPSPLPELPLQYVDFAHWQRQWLQGDALETQLDYWKRQLAGAPPVLELPPDRPRPRLQTFRGRAKRFQLEASLTENLKALSQRSEVTLFITLLTAFVTLLSRYSHQEHIVVGFPIANRNRREIEPLIGFFVNTLVLHADLSGEPAFLELLRRVREVALGAYDQQDLPFEKLVEELQPERSLSHTPLFQIMFAWQDAPLEELTLPDLTVTPMEIESVAAKFDLTLFMEETEGTLKGQLAYNADLFDAATITRLANHFQTLLAEIVTQPKQAITHLPLLTETEQHQILVTWNETQADFPKHASFLELFEAQVAQTPQAVAVTFADKQLTYQQLHSQANQVAHHLQALGVGPETLVGIYIERSLEMMIGLLGILKAGGAYVPLDPAYPQDRLAFIIQDAQVSVLLTQQKLLAAWPQPPAQVVCLDADWARIAQAGQQQPVRELTAENPAYVIYTSGSTGRPKGVQISHRALLNFLQAMRQSPGFTAQDVLLAVTTLSFDIAALELYLPLIVGGQVVLADQEAAMDGTQLLALLNNCGATVMQATPATWQMLLAAGWQGSSDLKIWCGGEVLPGELAAQLLGRGACLWNLYGPTETTIWSSVYKVEQVDPSSEASVSIGRPIANTQMYILDQHLQPVPLGVSGELYIGGAGLAQGYLHRPELTSQKFIPNPFAGMRDKDGRRNKKDFIPHPFDLAQDRPSSFRLYKTGDLARYAPDGNIEFLGRLDQQVKVRGFRIELGEVETVLAQHPVVWQAVVIVREDQPGDQRLVAYVVPQEQAEVAARELRHFLRQKLPEYMVPSAFVFLDALPLTPNNKIDRRALSPPPTDRPDLVETFVAPSNPVERVLAQIWAQLLNVEQIGIHDNFFELGGHSLLATQLMSRVQKTFRVAPPVRSLFEAPTVGELAEVLIQHETAPGQVAVTARLRQKLNQMSPEEVQAMLRERKQKG